MNTVDTPSENSKKVTACIVLADGTTFYGQGFGATGQIEAELCFNTSMTGSPSCPLDAASTLRAHSIKTFFSFVFFAQKKKQIRWEAGRGLSFFTEVAPVYTQISFSSRIS